jgi:xylulokinase
MFVGIDIGTTATKAILVNDRQRLVASSSRSYGVDSPIAGQAEQQPAAWIDAVRGCLQQIGREQPQALASTQRIGLSGQMHSLVLLDQSHVPIRPAILWNDSRGQAEADELGQEIADIEALSGAAAMPSFTAAKLIWMRRNRPELFRTARHVLLPKDVVRLWLTGDIGTDHSDAAGTQLYDQKARNWSAPLIAACGIDAALLPRISEGHDTAGRLRQAVAGEIGLQENIDVCFGGADTAAGALGLGCIASGDCFITLGTSAIYATVTNGYEPTHGGFLHNFAHCIPAQWYRMGAMLNGASCLAWAARLVGATDIGQLLDAVAAQYTGPSRLMFIPYLSGERTPHNNAALRGALLGLDSATGTLDLAQAVIEGVCFSIRDAMVTMGIDAGSAMAPGFIGGGARHPLWGRILSAVLGIALTRSAGADYWPALGAVRLAMLQSSALQLADVAQKPAVEQVTVPEPGLSAAYAERYDIYRQSREASFGYAAASRQRRPG